MKTFTFLLLGLCLSLPIFAQEKPDVPQLSSAELDKLVAPIALYPDSLIALVLPASTESADVVLAARYNASGGDPDAIDNQPWSDSVKSLARFPDLVTWMDENLAWTRQMGDVFEAQPADVMNAIQRMRMQARAAGLLTDSPQQKVVMQDDVICIVPAEPDVIYVPRYDPEILWMRRPYYGSFMTFGMGFGIGSWLYFDCDWFGHGIWMHHRQPGWAYHPGWRRPSGEVRVVVGAPWRPDLRHEHRARTERPSMAVAVRPSIMIEPRQDGRRRPANPNRPEFRGRPDNGGRADNRVERPDRSAPTPHVNRPSVPMPPSHTNTPPSSSAQRPSSVDHSQYRPSSGPQAQSPRESPRANRGSGDSPAVSTPRPPSHNPPPSQVPSAPPASSMRPSRSEPSGGAAPSVSQPAGRSTPASQPASQEKKESDEQRQTRERGQGARRQ